VRRQGLEPRTRWFWDRRLPPAAVVCQYRSWPARLSAALFPWLPAGRRRPPAFRV